MKRSRQMKRHANCCAHIRTRCSHRNGINHCNYPCRSIEDNVKWRFTHKNKQKPILALDLTLYPCYKENIMNHNWGRLAHFNTYTNVGDKFHSKLCPVIIIILILRNEKKSTRLKTVQNFYKYRPTKVTTFKKAVCARASRTPLRLPLITTACSGFIQRERERSRTVGESDLKPNQRTPVRRAPPTPSLQQGALWAQDFKAHSAPFLSLTLL